MAKALEERDGARAEAEALRAERDAAVDAARVAAAARQAALCDRDAALAERDAARSQAEFCRNECDAAMAADAAARAQGMELERLLKTALAEREAQVAELEKSLSDVREITIQRDAAVAELVRTQEIIGNQEDQIANLDAERLKIAEALTDLRKERDDLRAGTESLAARLKDSQEVAVRLQQQLDGLNAQGRRYNNELNSLEQDLKAKRLAIEERDALVVIQRQELERIKSSATWRLSRPFRALAGIGEVAGRKKRRSPGSSS